VPSPQGAIDKTIPCIQVHTIFFKSQFWEDKHSFVVQLHDVFAGCHFRAKEISKNTDKEYSNKNLTKIFFWVIVMLKSVKGKKRGHSTSKKKGGKMQEVERHTRKNGVSRRQRDPVWDSPKEEKAFRDKLIRFSMKELRFNRQKAEEWAKITKESFREVKTL